MNTQKGLEETEQSMLTEVKKLNLNENVISQNGNLIFNKQSPQKHTERVNAETSVYSTKPKEKASPAMSAKSGRSYKFPNPMRADLFSENDASHQQRPKYGGLDLFFLFFL